MQQSDRDKRYTAREERKQKQWPQPLEQDTLSATLAAKQREVGSSGTMGERGEGSPIRNRGRNDEEQETRELFRQMATGQQQVVDAMRALTTMIQQMNPQRR